eukprot:26132-Pyramimonas_sp.AAC.1
MRVDAVEVVAAVSGAVDATVAVVESSSRMRTRCFSCSPSRISSDRDVVVAVVVVAVAVDCAVVLAVLFVVVA